jgi:hypothetical protein
MTVNAYNTNQVIVGEAFVMTAPYGVASANQPEPMVSDLIPYGDPWGGNWTQIGSTNDGVTVGYEPKPVEIYIEEQPTPALVTIDTSNVSIKFTLAEDVLNNMLLAYGVGSIATQAASATQIGKSTYTFGITLNAYSLAFEANNAYGSSVASAGRSTATGSTVSASANFTDSTASFTDLDIGRTVTATGVPAGAFITSITSGTVAVLSAPATATGSTLPTVYGALAATPFFRRMYIPKALSGQATSSTQYRRAKAERMYDVEFMTICNINQILIVDQTASVT